MSIADSLESLKGFDVNDLDFKNAGSWPGPIKAIVFIVVFGAMIFCGYWFMIKDQYVELDKVSLQEVELKKQYEQKAHRVANLDAFREQMVEMEKTFGALLKQLPVDTEVPGLLEDITNTALGSGLDIDAIKLKPEVSKEFYVELPIDVAVTGSYHDLASFVSGVASLPRIVTLHNFNLAPVATKKGGDDLGGDMLKMRISAKTYRYSPDQGKKKRGKKGARKRGRK